MPETAEGLNRKYDVARLNDPEGKHDECPYFVLDIRHDRHARVALRAYAKSCQQEFPTLAHDLGLLAYVEKGYLDE